MTTFEEHVNSVKNHFSVGKAVKTIYGTSECGQRFAILITKVWWYGVRVIMDEEYRDQWNKKILFIFPQRPYYKSVLYSQFLTSEKAYNAAKKWEALLIDGKYEEFCKDMFDYSKKPIKFDVPAEWKSELDRHLHPGDVLQTSFKLFFHHEGIYVGNDEVIHVSAHGGKKRDSKARSGEILKNFINRDKLQIKVPRVRFRSDIEIVISAKEYAANEFRHGEYNLFTRSCQHFASLCSHNVENSCCLNTAGETYTSVSSACR